MVNKQHVTYNERLRPIQHGGGFNVSRFQRSWADAVCACVSTALPVYLLRYRTHVAARHVV